MIGSVAEAIGGWKVKAGNGRTWWGYGTRSNYYVVHLLLLITYYTCTQWRGIQLSDQVRVLFTNAENVDVVSVGQEKKGGKGKIL